MSILGTKSEYEEQDKLSFCPAVLNSGEEISLVKAIFISAFLHVAVTFALVVITAIIMFILQILGLDLNLFNKPEIQPKDIEFVLVNQEAKPKNPHTRFRSDKNSRAGGKHDPKKRISMPTAPTRASKPQKQASQPQKQIEKIIQKKRAEAKQQQQNQKNQNQNQQHKAQSQAKPNNAPPRPAPRASMPRPALPNLFSVPIPKNNLPKTLSGGGGGGAKSAKPHGTPGGGMSGSRAPAPVMSSGSGTRGQGRHSSPYSAGGGSLGNPQGGGGSPGIDAIAEPDFGPWMRDVEARIKRNWDPPKSDQSKRVVIRFTVAKDGRLVRTRILRPSGSATADRAAINAIEYSAPFKPLPRESRDSSVDINFTFDYNVFGGNVR